MGNIKNYWNNYFLPNGSSPIQIGQDLSKIQAVLWFSHAFIAIFSKQKIGLDLRSNSLHSLHVTWKGIEGNATIVSIYVPHWEVRYITWMFNLHYATITHNYPKHTNNTTTSKLRNDHSISFRTSTSSIRFYCDRTVAHWRIPHICVATTYITWRLHCTGTDDVRDPTSRYPTHYLCTTRSGCDAWPWSYGLYSPHQSRWKPTAYHDHELSD